MSKRMTLEDQIEATYGEREDEGVATREKVAIRAAHEACYYYRGTLDDDTAPHAPVDSPEDEDREKHWLKLLLKDARRPGNRVIWLA